MKLQKRVTQNTQLTTTDYLDGYQYVDGKLEFYPHAEGYVKVKEDNTLQYVYHYTDHLGNVRLSYTKGSDGKAQVVEESNYYPFGLKHQGYNNNSNTLTDKYKYGYQGQELQNELGLGWSSFKWRNADPALGRFMSVDPLAEEYHWQSTYQFASNQPIHDNEVEGLENNNDLNKRTDQLLNEAQESFKNVLDISAEVKGKVGLVLDIGVQLGAVEGKAEVAVLDGKVSVDMDDQKVKLNGRAGAASASLAFKPGGVEHSKISGNATALNVSTGASLDSTGGVKVDNVSTEGSLTASGTIDSNGASLKLTHKDIKIGGQVGLFRAVKVKGSVNIGELGNGLVKGFAGMASYLSDRVNESINNVMEKINNQK